MNIDGVAAFRLRSFTGDVRHSDLRLWHVLELKIIKLDCFPLIRRMPGPDRMAQRHEVLTPSRSKDGAL
jgi:hypothetical protein